MGYLTWADYLVFITFLVISSLIGIYHGFAGGKEKTTSEFLLGNRQLPVIPTMLSLMVSFQSAILFLGFVAEMYAHGFTMWPGYIMSITLCLIVTERWVLPVFYPLKLTSLYEYLDLRYNSKVLRKLASVLGILFAIIYMSLALYAPCIALEYISGFSLKITIPLMAVVCMFYTAFGGLKAVIWTDVFQCVIMLGGMLIIVVKGTYDVGGVGHVFSTMKEHGRIHAISFSFDPRERHTFWGFLIGHSMYWLAGYGISQASVQRYCSTSTLKDARRVLLWTIPAIVLIASLTCYGGFVIFTHFINSQCDPVGSKYVGSYNLVLPVYMVDVFSKYQGLIGVFMAMLYGGALSSISSSLSGASANTWQDLVKPVLPKMTEVKATLLTKIIVIVYGILAIMLAFVLDKMPGTITKITVQLMGAIASPICGIFIMALCFRKSEYIGAIVGCLCGFSTVMLITVGSMSVKTFSSSLSPTSISGCPVNQTMHSLTRTIKPAASGFSHLFTISYLWYLSVGVLVTIVVGLLVSTIVKWKNSDYSEVPNELFINFRRGFAWNDDAYVKKTDFKGIDNEINISVTEKDDGMTYMKHAYDEGQSSRL